MPTLPHTPQLVAASAARLHQTGRTNIKADHLPNFVRPDQIGNYIPDVTGNHPDGFVIIEAESREGLAQTHTADQWRTFHNHAKRVGGYFIASVNLADEAAAKKLLVEVCGNSSNALVWTF